MNFQLVNLFTAATAIVLLAVVVNLLRTRKLRERHAVWWLVLGFLALIVTIFPAVLDWFAALMGVEVPLNLGFFAAIVVLFLVSMQQSKELTKSEERTRILAEHVALLEDRLIDGQTPKNVSDSTQ